MPHADWNQWRGPGRDGRCPAPLGTRKPIRSWRVTVGAGHASPLATPRTAFVFSREGENEVTRALDLASGNERWRESYPAPYAMNPAARGHGKGPKSTPALSGGRLYTFGISGILSCLDAATGKLWWRKEFAREHKTTSPLYGAAASPLVDRGLLFVHVGGHDDGALTAFDARTSAVRWRWTGDGPGYASPVLATLSGVRQLVTQTQTLCLGLDPATGRELWRFPFRTPYDQNAVTPTVAGDRVVFGGVQQPTIALQVGPGGARKVWETREATFYMSTPVADGAKLWGFSERRSGQMVCLHAATGKLLWEGEGRQGENASLWDDARALLALTTDGQLRVFAKRGGSLTETARYPVAESAVWASPAFVPEGFLVKDEATLAWWRWV